MSFLTRAAASDLIQLPAIRGQLGQEAKQSRSQALFTSLQLQARGKRKGHCPLSPGCVGQMAGGRESPLATRRSPEPFCGPGRGRSDLGRSQSGDSDSAGASPRGLCVEVPGQGCRSVCADCPGAQAEATGAPSRNHSVPAAPPVAVGKAASPGQGSWTTQPSPDPCALSPFPPAFVHLRGGWPHTCPCPCVRFPHWAPMPPAPLLCSSKLLCVLSAPAFTQGTWSESSVPWSVESCLSWEDR